jgi:putative peptide zinc metalloprotease protein
MITDQQQSSMQPSTQRVIPLSIRPDLVMKRIDYLGVGYWVVKDPAGLKYFRLQQEQYEVLRLLDSNRSLENVREEMLKIMPTVRLQLSDIQHLITDLHEKGLVYSNREGQGAALIKKHGEEKKKKFFNTLRSLLYVRLPGWDPEAVLTIIYPFFRWMFSPFAVALFAVTVLSSWTLLAVQFDSFRQELPGFQQFFGWPNLIYMWMVLGICKVIHEFGHGLSCKHFGGECHEMGVMLLVFSPCLYCDVSDSWMLRSKWPRIMIGAAGMYIEILISALAIFVWWYTTDGMLHMLAINTFFVTTVTTVIFNANPLMRFDGYYMMSDFLEIPNLRPKADRLLRDSFGWYCLGIEAKPDPFMPETGRAWFVTFAIAAAIYRWFIVVAITLFLYTVLKPYGLQSIGVTLAFVSVTTIVGNMANNLYKMISTPRIEPMSKPKICLTLSVLTIVFVSCLAIPMPLHIEATFILEPLDVEHIYNKTPGQIVEFGPKPGEWVNERDIVAKLSNPEMEDEISSLILKRDLQKIQRDTQLKLGNTSEMVVADERKAALELQIAEVQRQLDDLEIRAPVSGRVVAPPRVAAPGLDMTHRQLSGWNGTPLHEKNIGAVVEERTHLVSIAPSNQFQAIVLIEQGDRNELIHKDDFAERLAKSESQTIELKFDHLPALTYEGTVEHVSKNTMDYVPELLSNKLGGDLATVTDGQGRERLASPVYQATVRVTKDLELLRTGMRGKARFLVEERTAGQWLWRYLRQTFHFRL